MNEEELFDSTEEQSMAFSEGGKCIQCGKATDAFCDICNAWICESHLVNGKEDGECFCAGCIEKEKADAEN